MPFSCPDSVWGQLNKLPIHSLTDWFWNTQRDPRHLWPLRHLINVLRKHDLTNEKTMQRQRRIHLKSGLWDLWPFTFVHSNEETRPNQERDEDEDNDNDNSSDKDNPRDLWPLRPWLQFWFNLNSWQSLWPDAWQHSQFLLGMFLTIRFCPWWDVGMISLLLDGDIMTSLSGSFCCTAHLYRI